MMMQFNEYKELLSIESTDQAFDGKLQKLINRVEGKVRAYLGYPVEEQQTTELQSGKGGHLISLSVPCIVSIEKVEHWNGTEWIELIAGTDYNRLSFNFGIVYLEGYRFSEGIDNYRVTYTSGFPESKIPEDIKGVCNDLLQLAYANSSFGKNLLGISSRNDNRQNGSQSTSFDLNAENRILKRLDRWRAQNV